MPAYTYNPFWSGGSYGGFNPITGLPQDWYDTPLSQQAELPYGEYERFLSNQGFGGFDNRSQWARSMYNRSSSGYDAAQLSNPDLTYREYLNTLTGQLDDAWASLTPDQRGISTPGQTRWVRWG